MVFSIFTLISALSISCVAAYFSILGLATIFPGSQMSVVIMGIVLEIGKIIAAVWLHKNWKAAGFLIKSYLSFAVVVLMGITSMGIFGFLSKSHIEHQAQSLQEETLIASLENKIEKEKELMERQELYIENSQKRITYNSGQSGVDSDRAEKRIEQLLATLDKNIAIEQGRIDKIEARRGELDDMVAALEAQSGGLFSNKKKKLEELKAAQAAERTEITTSLKTYNSNIENFRSSTEEKITDIRASVDSTQSQAGDNFKEIQIEIDGANTKIRESLDRISGFEQEKLKYGEKIRALEAEIGPLKYVAEAVEDLGGSELEADRAVRIIILILMLVFDPLAVLLVLAANHSLGKYFKPKKKIEENPTDSVLEKEVIKEVIKEVEVPVEVIKEVVKEVEVAVEVEKPIEVIKEVIKEVEVPVEVEKPVEVIKEVIKEIPLFNKNLEEQHSKKVEELNAEISKLRSQIPPPPAPDLPDNDKNPGWDN